MLKETITYTDYNGVSRTEDFYFNLTKAELMEMEMGIAGGFAEYINQIIAAQDVPSLMKIFKEIILKSVGKKSADGRLFIKNEEIATEFSQTEAYSELFMKLSTDDGAAAKFINGIMPAEIAEQAVKMEMPTNGIAALSTTNAL